MKNPFKKKKKNYSYYYVSYVYLDDENRQTFGSSSVKLTPCFNLEKAITIHVDIANHIGISKEKIAILGVSKIED